VRELPQLGPLARSRLRPQDGLLAVARPDRSGRLSVRGLLRALAWEPGQRLTLDVDDGAVVVCPSAAGAHGVDERGALVLPASVRRMANVEPGTSVVIAAFVALDMLEVHPAQVVVQLLVERRG
jgi:bifunctional DNA-binding transcriptional regulator/antitoxin component of YhaV-PrlF toxin-antitoxin module